MKPRAVALSAPAGGTHIITTPGLWVMARDGSGLRRLLGDRPDAVAWSPDDTHVALGRNGGIDILNVADGTTTRLAKFAGPILVVSLAWSPNGRLIAANVTHNPGSMIAQGGPSYELIIVDTVTGTTTSLGPDIDGADHVSWSAKGCLGWVSKTVDLWCPGSSVSNLPPFPGSDLFVWSPDGARYAITSSDDAAPGAIRTYAADGSAQVDLGNRMVYPLQWVGDGRSIVFQVIGDRLSRLWVQPVGGGPASALADAAPFAVNGVDDGLMLDTGHTVGHHAIVSLNVSNPTQHQLVTLSASGGVVERLTWARDGRWLLADTVPSA